MNANDRDQSRCAGYAGGAGDRLADVGATIAWSQWLRAQSASRAAALLLVRLDRLGRVELAPQLRLDLLRVLRHALLRLTAALPSPDPRRPGAGLGGGRGLTMEQRLDRAMCVNLGRLFQELDRSRYRCAAAGEDNRDWVLRNLFKFLRRQVRYAVLARRDCPPGTWQDLHDLFVYLVIRGNVSIEPGVRLELHGDGFDPAVEYKRLLLLGRAHQLVLSGAGLLRMIPRLTDWSRGSRLVDPGWRTGVFDQLLVEVSRDRPLRLDDGGRDHTFRGWVFKPDPRFIETCRREAAPPQPFAGYRRA